MTRRAACTKAISSPRSAKFELIPRLQSSRRDQGDPRRHGAHHHRLAHRRHSRIRFNPLRLARLLLLVIATALALISMMFLLVVRMNDPLLPRRDFRQC